MVANLAEVTQILCGGFVRVCSEDGCPQSLRHTDCSVGCLLNGSCGVKTEQELEGLVVHRHTICTAGLRLACPFSTVCPKISLLECNVRPEYLIKLSKILSIYMSKMGVLQPSEGFQAELLYRFHDLPFRAVHISHLLKSFGDVDSLVLGSFPSSWTNRGLMPRKRKLKMLCASVGLA